MQQLSSMNPGHSTFVQQWLGQVDGGEGKKGPEKMLLSSRGAILYLIGHECTQQ